MHTDGSAAAKYARKQNTPDESFLIQQPWGPYASVLWRLLVHWSRMFVSQASTVISTTLCMQTAGANHYWLQGDDVPYKFELGGPSHEACAGVVALSQYLNIMSGKQSAHVSSFV